MSYGPGPTSVGTLFMNANNSVASVWSDSTNTPGDCDFCKGDGSGDPGGGGGTGGGTGGGDPCANKNSGAKHIDLYYVPTGSGSPARSPSNLANVSSDFHLDMVGAHYPPCYKGIRIMAVSSSSPCEVLPLDAPTGLMPGCVAPQSRIALFPEGCLAAADVQVGDLLLTRRADGTCAGEAVTAIRTSTQPCVRLETEAGHLVHCSLSHEIMVADPTLPQGRRTVVSGLTLDDCLLLENGTPVALRRITPEPDGPVIQISLSGPEHLYLSDGLWSHNKPQPVWPA